MAKHSREEIELFHTLHKSAELRSAGLNVELGLVLGVVVNKAGIELGSWGFVGGRFVLRQLASYDPIASATDYRDVVAFTLQHLSHIP